MMRRHPTLVWPLSNLTKSRLAEMYGAPSSPCCRWTGSEQRSASSPVLTTCCTGASDAGTSTGATGLVSRRFSSPSSPRSSVSSAMASRLREPMTLPQSSARSGPVARNNTALGLPSSLPATSISSICWSCVSHSPACTSESTWRRSRKRSVSTVGIWVTPALRSGAPFARRLMDRTPYPFGCGGHLHMGDAQLRQRIRDGADDDGKRRRRAAFAAAAHAEPVGRRRHFHDLRPDRRKVARPRHRVIHQRAGQHLATVRIVVGVLHKSLSVALRHRAVGLAVQDQRIDRAPYILHGNDRHDLDAAGVGIDLDLAGLCAVG